MKKQASGKQKQVKNNISKRRFVSNKEKTSRLKRWRIKLTEKNNKQTKSNKRLMEVISEYNDALEAAQAEAAENETQEKNDEALFTNEEPKED